MKFLTYINENNQEPGFGFKYDDLIINIRKAAEWIHQDIGDNKFLTIPKDLITTLEDWDNYFPVLKEMEEIIQTGDTSKFSKPELEVKILPPVMNPPAFRDFYAFEQHVRSARKLRGLEMHPDWFKIPIFYFSNPAAIYGHGEEISYPRKTNELDFELEFAIIIAGSGSDISSKDAEKHIAGYTICNDWSARDLQREEMAMNLGPAKGKDFATSFGPFMITPDELEDAWDANGKLNLRMTCHVNGNLISDGNTNDLYHPFKDMIERASMNTKLVSGDYLGSGTVGTGCILELKPENTGGWIKKDDVVTLEVERLGVLENRIV